jgi:hypothetical protein
VSVVIEHLAKIVSPSLDWKNVKLGMFTACFDASGSQHDQVSVVVAGLLSTADGWISFDSDWRARLAEDGIEFFRMSEFAQSQGQFVGWDRQETKRRAILSDLSDIIFNHAFRKFGCAVVNKTFTEHFSEKNRHLFRINSYCLAAMTAAATVDNWAESERIRTPVELVFEDGDEGKGMLMDRMSGIGRPLPVFRPKKDRASDNGAVVKGFTPLQAADMLAYEMFVNVRNYHTNLDRPFRWGLRQFAEMPGNVGYFTPSNTDNFDAMLRAVAILLPEG